MLESTVLHFFSTETGPELFFRSQIRTRHALNPSIDRNSRARLFSGSVILGVDHPRPQSFILGLGDSFWGSLTLGLCDSFSGSVIHSGAHSLSGSEIHSRPRWFIPRLDVSF